MLITTHLSPYRTGRGADRRASDPATRYRRRGRGAIGDIVTVVDIQLDLLRALALERYHGFGQYRHAEQ
ncbi:hypothetical protein D3C79_832670 [compost metagenome]